jgi:hypothetical protein
MALNSLLNLLGGDSIILGGDTTTQKTNNLYAIGEGSKALDYGVAGQSVVVNEATIFNISQPSSGPLLGKRVEFNGFNTENINPRDLKTTANPTFLYPEGSEGYTRGTQIDNFVRGGAKYAREARQIDTRRITTFLASSNGKQFIAKQVALQLLNPREETNLFNGGLSLLASVGSSGVVNFRRHGLIPTPANSTLAQGLGLPSTISLGGVGEAIGIESIGLGGDYVSVTPFNRVQNFNTGDPGKPSTQNLLQKIIDLDKPKDPRIYQAGTMNEDLESNIDKVDKLNALDVIEGIDSVPRPTVFKGKFDQNGDKIFEELKESDLKDMINFRFEIYNYKNSNTDLIAFRAFIDGYSDRYSANHNTVKYNGRGEEFYTYNSFNRDISVDFKIAAQSRHEMQPLYRKLNYLIAQTAPSYNEFSGRIQTPYLLLTMGDYFKRVPGVVKGVNIGWQKDYTWEIALDKTDSNSIDEPKDKFMLVLPHVLDVSVSFQPIHGFTPNNNINTPFIGIEEYLTT